MPVYKNHRQTFDSWALNVVDLGARLAAGNHR
jgi:hypothetical protein